MSLREEFEASVLSKYPNQNMGRFSDGEYQSVMVQYCWEFWQASRAALVVELPKSESLSSPEALCLYDEVKFELETAGVQVKP